MATPFCPSKKRSKAAARWWQPFFSDLKMSKAVAGWWQPQGCGRVCFSYPSETKSPRLWQRAGNHFFTLLKKAQGCGSVLATIFYPVLKNVQGRGTVVATIFRPLLQMSKAVTGWWQPFFTLLMKNVQGCQSGPARPGLCGLGRAGPG